MFTLQPNSQWFWSPSVNPVSKPHTSLGTADASHLSFLPPLPYLWSVSRSLEEVLGIFCLVKNK